ncbi:hypothetical protein KKH23_09230, partial [Patescibacteria group bacterium]|nr:hypothetical protein [Patescibacteria group bacterium]
MAKKKVKKEATVPTEIESDVKVENGFLSIDKIAEITNNAAGQLNDYFGWEPSFDSWETADKQYWLDFVSKFVANRKLNEVTLHNSELKQ